MILAPLTEAPALIVDHRFPIVANQGYSPPNFPLDEYLAETKPLGVRAVRFNLFRGRIDSVDDIAALAPRVHSVAG